MKYKKPNLICYRIAQIVSWLAATVVFKRKILRNEIRGKKGPFVVIANHEAALDFVNLIGATSRRMSFVISNSFFSTLPIRGFIEKMGVIPKQQFQTSADDLKKMKRVIDAGQPMVLYPAGLMCEDGLSTPIPAATYKFLKWLGVDVYVARTQGTYFVMPKWSKKLRPGRTYMDIYRLFTKEELAKMDLRQIQEATDRALLYDAYAEQENLMVKYKQNQNIQGLENVLYQCPNCGGEFTMHIQGKDKISCKQCGFAQQSDAFGFLHKTSIEGTEIRHVSQWSRDIYARLSQKIAEGQEQWISCATRIFMVDHKKKKFVEAGAGTVTLSSGKFLLEGTLNGSLVRKEISVGNVPTLPFSPGKHFEIQDGKMIYRCVLEDGKMVMKFINMLKIFYEQAQDKKNVKVG